MEKHVFGEKEGKEREEKTQEVIPFYL